jgi:hypothetical protein
MSSNPLSSSGESAANLTSEQRHDLLGEEIDRISPLLDRRPPETPAAPAGVSLVLKAGAPAAIERLS